jgi:TonB-linked SusC/RagA family outer membrane protein
LYENFSAKRENLISGDVPVIKLGVGNDYTNDSESDWAIRGIFTRFNYDYKGKYLLEMNGRYDGTSKFPKESRFAFFPSISVGWRIMEESFMENIRTVIDDFKLRASYGSLGNQNVSGNYPYISNFGVNQNVAYIIDGQLPIGLTPPGIVSADLTWETTTTLNFGFDATIIGKLDFSFDWYKRETTNMLTAGDKLPSVLGTGVPRRNNADLETKGWELSTVWRDKLDNGLQYDIGVVLSDYQAVITKFDANPNKIYTSYYVDQKIGEIWGYETVGLFQSTEEVTNSPNQNQLGNAGKWGPGDVRYANLNDDDVINWGDRTVDNPGDTKIIGNSTPRYQYGITGNIKYKSIDFNVFFQGIGKRDFMPVGNYFWGHNANAVATANYDIWKNSWREDNQDAYFPIYKGGSSYNRLTQTRFLQSGAYVRLKNITIGYTLPPLLSTKMKMSNLRIYLAGYNLWEYASLRGNFDPEQVENLGQHYPMQRSYLFGIEVTF